MEKHKKALTILILIIFGVLTLGLVGCKNAKGAPQQLSESKFAYTYGVFLSVDNTNLSRFDDFETIVIDAEYFDKEDISKLKKDGHIVYSYINIGSIETFRTFYDRFVGITLGAYANWDEERWVNVSKTEWQNFVTGEIATEYVDKGIDGFFVDNCDVYYNFAKSEIFEGVGKILKKLVATGKKVVVNGGDCFVTEYLQKFGNVGDILTGVNQ
ncbi:MAG: endo alpha-1,4 polygalactosaminidase, partial [Clostridia bacterium]